MSVNSDKNAVPIYTDQPEVKWTFFYYLRFFGVFVAALRTMLFWRIVFRQFLFPENCLFCREEWSSVVKCSLRYVALVEVAFTCWYHHTEARGHQEEHSGEDNVGKGEDDVGKGEDDVGKGEDDVDDGEGDVGKGDTVHFRNYQLPSQLQALGGNTAT